MIKNIFFGVHGVKKPHYAPSSSRPEEQMISPTILYQIKAREKLHLGALSEQILFVTLLRYPVEHIQLS